MPLNSIHKILFAVLILGLCLPALVSAKEPFSVSEVRIDGNRRVELQAILPLIAVKPNQSFTREDVDRDIRAIYKLGLFEDIRADIEERGGAKVLIYSLDERPLVRKVEIKGNDEIELSKLREAVTLKIPDIYEPRVVEESVAAMRVLYVTEGYHAVEIDPQLDVSPANEATVTFEIKEGEKALVGSIVFEGNSVFDSDELLEIIQTKERWFLSWLTDRGTYVPEMLENDVELIADHYYNHGYLQVIVKQPKVELSADKKNLNVAIEIEEGDQFKIGKIDFEGDLIRSPERLLQMVSSKPGKVFSRRELRRNLLKINDFYADAGFAYVNVTPLTHLDPERNLVDLKFAIEQGIRVKIGRIDIRGNTRTRDKVIRREMRVVEGDLFNASRVKLSKRKINNLGFFDEVEINTRKTDNEDILDVDIAVKERATGTFSLGAGYSSVDGIIAQGAITQNNFLGRALKLDFSASVGGISTTYNLGLLDPYFLDSKVSLGFDVFKTDREYTSFDRKTSGFDLKFGVPIWVDNRAFFIYRYEKKNIYNVDPNADFEIREQEGESILSSITGTLSRDVTNNRLDPTRGHVTSLAVEYAGIGGTEKFTKVVFDYRHFLPFLGPTYFSLHGRIGEIFPHGDDPTPIDERFFLGGIHTLRGLPARKVGPRVRRVEHTVDPVSGVVTGTSEIYDYVGGERNALANVDFLFPLVPELKLKGVLFFDTGNAWRRDEDYFSTMRYSVGGGVRWHSPMGPMRLEWGYNLDPRDDEEDSQFEFSVGRFF